MIIFSQSMRGLSSARASEMTGGELTAESDCPVGGAGVRARWVVCVCGGGVAKRQSNRAVQLDGHQRRMYIPFMWGGQIDQVATPLVGGNQLIIISYDMNSETFASTTHLNLIWVDYRQLGVSSSRPSPCFCWCVREKLSNLFVDLLAHNVLLAAGMFLLSNFDLLSIRVSELYPTSYWVA